MYKALSLVVLAGHVSGGQSEKSEQGLCACWFFPENHYGNVSRCRSFHLVSTFGKQFLICSSLPLLWSLISEFGHTFLYQYLHQAFLSQSDVSSRKRFGVFQVLQFIENDWTPHCTKTNTGKPSGYVLNTPKFMLLSKCNSSSTYPHLSLYYVLLLIFTLCVTYYIVFPGAMLVPISVQVHLPEIHRSACPCTKDFGLYFFATVARKCPTMELCNCKGKRLKCFVFFILVCGWSRHVSSVSPEPKPDS